MEELTQLLESLRRATEDAARFKAGERFYGDRWAAYGVIVLRNRIGVVRERLASKN